MLREAAAHGSVMCFAVILAKRFTTAAGCSSGNLVRAAAPTSAKARFPGSWNHEQRQKRNEAFEALITRLRKDVPVTIDESKLQELWK